MTDEELQAIEARANAATPGPWDTVDGDDTIYSNPRPAKKGGTYFDAVICEMREDMDTDEVSWADERFICHARTDVPALIAALRETRARLAEAEVLFRNEANLPAASWGARVMDWLAKGASNG